jgi:mRNA interferase YafQ
LILTRSTQFKKDYELLVHQGKDISKLDSIIVDLANNVNLEGKYKIYQHSGWQKLYRTMYIAPDWILIYKLDEAKGELALARTGNPANVN